MTEIEIDSVVDFANTAKILNLRPIFVDEQEFYTTLFSHDGHVLYRVQMSAGELWRDHFKGFLTVNARVPFEVK